MPSSERRNILVVDDDAALRTMLELALDEEGFAFDSAENGLDALQKVRRSPPDLVILDLDMPRMGGEEFLYAWSVGVQTRGVPVIVITGTSAALKPTDLGVEAVFPKPFDVDKLLWHIRDLLALPPPAPLAERGRDRAAGTDGVLVDLVDVVSILLVTAEQLADAPNLPDEVRSLTATALDAAHRASALVHRLNQHVGALE